MRSQLLAGILLGSLVLGSSTHAQSAMTNSQSVPTDFLHNYYEAYSPERASQLRDFYAPDATFTDPSFGLNLKGREEIGSLLERALAKYERLGHEILHSVTSGNELVVEGLMVARLNGKDLRVRYVSVFTFANGKIATQRDLYDLLHYYEQLGVVPSQFRPKPPPSH